MPEKAVKFEFKKCGDPNGSRPFAVTEAERQQSTRLKRFIWQSMHKNAADLLWSTLCLKFHCAVFGPLKGMMDHSHIVSDYIYKEPEDFFRRIGIEEDVADKNISGKPFLFPSHAPEGQHQSYFPQWGVVSDPVEKDSVSGFMDLGKTVFEVGGLYHKISISLGPVLQGENEGSCIISHIAIHNGNDVKALNIDKSEPYYERALIDNILDNVAKTVHAIKKNDPRSQDMFDAFAPVYEHLAEWQRRKKLCDEDAGPEYKPFSKVSP